MGRQSVVRGEFRGELRGEFCAANGAANCAAMNCAALLLQALLEGVGHLLELARRLADVLGHRHEALRPQHEERDQADHAELRPAEAEQPHCGRRRARRHGHGRRHSDERRARGDDRQRARRAADPRRERRREGRAARENEAEERRFHRQPEIVSWSTCSRAPPRSSRFRARQSWANTL